MFTEIEQMMRPGEDLALTIRKMDEGRLIVSVLPKNNNLKDPAAALIPPLTLNGTGEELDGGFIAAISEPVKKSQYLLRNMEEFEKGMKASSEASKAEEERKKAEKATREKTDKLVKQAEEEAGKKNYSKAKQLYSEAITSALEADKKNISDALNALNAKIAHTDIFGVLEENAEVQAVGMDQGEASEEPKQEDEYSADTDEYDNENDEEE